MLYLFLLVLLAGFLAHSLSKRWRVPFIALILLFALLSKAFLGPMEGIRELAELGSIMLLYTIGLELKGRGVVRMGATAFLHALLKIALATAILYFLFTGVGVEGLKALALAFALSISSTAAFSLIVKEEGIERMKESVFLLTSLVWEDVIAVVGTITLYYYFLHGSLTIVAVGEVVLLLLASLLIYKLTAWLEEHVVEGEEGEFFFHLFILFLLVGIAHALKAPEGLAAFLAGLISGRHKSIGVVQERISHFTAFFILVFFFSMGLEVEGLPEPVGLVALAFLASVVVKVVITALFLLLEGSPPFRAAHFALLFSTTGEFSLLMGLIFRPFVGDILSILSFVAFLSLLLVPFVLSFSPHLADRLRRVRVKRERKREKRIWKGYRKGRLLPW